ncbi:hypothetical protein [Alloacidobacterium sp.]|uniref:hypothetical protein n=1 Tax=Alloacidobacterium sp. TaxID=2951999 RepID=UPI002D615DBC|nr:hypothetical protein [Alloacidobacterium sp.]HYK37788.1 hypothetical protein [Alloacidobacterium sp.]
MHSVLIGILVGGLVAGSGKEKVRRPLALAAVGVSTVWILYVVSTWDGYPQTFGANGTNGLINSFNDRATDLATLVSGTLAYLCQKRSDGISAAPPE